MSEWQPIETRPKDEATSFFVLWENEDNAMVSVQVSNFEGNMYPDALGGNIDYSSRILPENCTHWTPLLPPPSKK